MKDNETKLAFIQARAEGKSYATISKELGIAKATCTSWEQSLRGEIDALKREQLEELYTAYSMKKEARIKALGGILQGLDNAIAQKPLEELPADKLLELRLKYGRELKEEYTGATALETDSTLDGLLEQYDQLYTDSLTGDCDPAGVKARLSILEAKMGVIYRIAGEQSREENNGALDFSFMTQYKSKLIRHENRRDT